MNNNLQLLTRGLKTFLMLIPLSSTWLAQAQQYNIAPAATTALPNAGQSGDGLGPHSPTWTLNDGFVGTFPSTAVSGRVQSGGNFEYSWAGKQTVNEIRIYNSDNILESCTIEYDNGSGYQTLVTYSNRTNKQADTVRFAAVEVQKIRFSRMQPADKVDYISFREIEVLHAPATGNNCPSLLSAGTILPASQTVCLGANATLIANEYSFADAIQYQWQINNGGTWTDIADATNTWYSFRITNSTPTNATYRLKVTCSGSTVYTTTPSTVTVSGGHNPTYASVPYTENFEAAWLNGCGTGDIPSASWTITPITDPHVWKRNTAYGGKETKMPETPNGTAFARFGSSFKSATRYHGHMDLHVNCSAPMGDKLMYFYYVNQPDPQGRAYPDGNDALTVSISKDGGKTFEPIASFTTQQDWAIKTVPIISNSANTIIRFTGRTQMASGSRDGSDIGVDSIYIAPPCSGSVTAGSLLPVEKICAGTSATLAANGSSQGGGIHYQWEQSENGSSNWIDAMGGNGATTPNFQTPNLYKQLYYRLRVTCENGNDTKVTPAVRINMDVPTYANLPFEESFEEWSKRCDTANEIPSNNWVNNPATGKNSWRRNDYRYAWGYTEQWSPSEGQMIFSDWVASSGKYDPPAFHGEYSARFHANGNPGGVGSLLLFIDCSKQTGEKELSFALNLSRDFPNRTSTTFDYLNVLISTDGGLTFTLLEKYEGPAYSKWELKSILFNSNSANTVIQFQAIGGLGYKDIGLDYVRVKPACTEKPSAGQIDSTTACINTDFHLQLIGHSKAAGMTYQWQRANTRNGSWINMPGNTSDIYFTQIADTNWFRVIVTCVSGNQKDTTPVRQINPSPFYDCYCESGYTSERTLNNNFQAPHFGKNVGNITITTPSGSDTVLNNGDYKNHYSYPSPEFGGYKDYRHKIDIPTLYLDSQYNFIIHAIYSSTVGSNPVKWAAYIDFNQDGTYDTINERIWIDLTNNQDTRYGGNPVSEYGIKIPADAKTGTTGMRVVMMGGGGARIEDWNLGPKPCGLFGDGETEDYLVSIEEYPCTTVPKPGTITSNVTKICPGYELNFMSGDKGEMRPTAGWEWQYAADGSNWSTIANSNNVDTLTYKYEAPGSFRLVSYCGNIKDSAYSNVIEITSREAYQCYCYSTAEGKINDTSDVGFFNIGTYAFGKEGAHLNNTDAIYGRTDYTEETLKFFVDSSYEIKVSHILRNAQHADAVVSLYIDYNNNLAYEANELAWTGTTTASNWILSDSITIPSDAKVAVKTGMRLIINNNLSEPNPTEHPCGGFVSGETEDFVVEFDKRDPTNIEYVNNIKDIKLFPNPSSGKVYLQYWGTAQQAAQIHIINVQGQVVSQLQTADVLNGRNIELPTASLTAGVYFVHFQAGEQNIIRKLTLLQ